MLSPQIGYTMGTGTSPRGGHRGAMPPLVEILAPWHAPPGKPLPRGMPPLVNFHNQHSNDSIIIIIMYIET